MVAVAAPTPSFQNPDASALSLTAVTRGAAGRILTRPFQQERCRPAPAHGSIGFFFCILKGEVPGPGLWPTPHNRRNLPCSFFCSCHGGSAFIRKSKVPSNFSMVAMLMDGPFPPGHMIGLSSSGLPIRPLAQAPIGCFGVGDIIGSGDKHDRIHKERLMN